MHCSTCDTHIAAFMQFWSPNITMALTAGSSSCSHLLPGSSHTSTPQAVFALLSNAQQLAADLAHVPGMQDISHQLRQMLQQQQQQQQQQPTVRQLTGAAPPMVTRQQWRQLPPPPPLSEAPAEPDAPLVSLAAAVAAALRQEQQADGAHQQDQPAAAPARQQGLVPAPSAAAGSAAKSVLLELADQLGAAALAAAEAALASGQPLSYQHLMARMQAGWEQWLGAQGHSLADVLGAQLQQPATGSSLDPQQLHKLVYFSQHYATTHVLHIGTTKFKRDSRALGLERWPQRRFASVIEALAFLQHKAPASRDASDVPGRMLVLQHAWWLLSSRPNLKLELHPAYAVMNAKSKQAHKVRKRTAAEVAADGGSNSSSNSVLEEGYSQAEAAADAEAHAGRSASPPPIASAATTTSMLGAVQAMAVQVQQAAGVWPAPLQYLEQQARQHLHLPGGVAMA